MTAVLAVVKTPWAGVSMKISNWEQGSPAPTQSQPDSLRQLELQPSPLIALPSSHVSAGSITALPHEKTQMLGWPRHDHPTSWRQKLPEQPSPEPASPSSQVSSPRMKPSPQIGKQLLGCDVH